MAFDWQGFLDRHGVDYTTQKTDLYIHCPFCGSADAGRHLGISIVGKGWGCWRQQSHRGKAPARLVQALLGCSWQEALAIAGGTASRLQGLGGFMAAVQGALGTGPPAAAPVPLVKPREFRPLRPGPVAAPFYGYLAQRGFTSREVELMAHDHLLHYAITGDWSYRIIIPVQDECGTWLTWTGRAISAHAKVRYKTLTSNADKAAPGEQLAAGPINNYLLDLPYLMQGGRTLVIAEGPFDAMRIALFADQFGAKATCLFGKAVSPAQVDLLTRLAPLYRDMVLLLDPDAALDAMTLQSRLAPLAPLSHLLQGSQDPGEMSPAAIKGLLGSLPKRRPRATQAQRLQKGD